MKSNKRGLSNVEIVLLQLICEKKETSGYKINLLIQERGYREWADIGTTSIYVGLEKLKTKKLVDSFIDEKKTGKGPLPKKFKLNQRGKAVLENEILNALSNTRERDRKFDIGIAGIPFTEREKAVASLNKRKKLLLDSYRKIEGKFKSDGGGKLAFHTRAVFQHPLFLIKHEIKFINFLKKEIKNGHKGKTDN